VRDLAIIDSTLFDDVTQTGEVGKPTKGGQSYTRVVLQYNDISEWEWKCGGWKQSLYWIQVCITRVSTLRADQLGCGTLLRLMFFSIWES
jgi:hypothetical protein